MKTIDNKESVLYLLLDPYIQSEIGSTPVTQLNNMKNLLGEIIEIPEKYLKIREAIQNENILTLTNEYNELYENIKKVVEKSADIENHMLDNILSSVMKTYDILRSMKGRFNYFFGNKSCFEPDMSEIEKMIENIFNMSFCVGKNKNVYLGNLYKNKEEFTDKLLNKDKKYKSYGKIIREIIEKMTDRICEEKEFETVLSQDSIFISGGFSNDDSGHCIMQYLSKNESGNYKFAICNSGAGVGYHGRKDNKSYLVLYGEWDNWKIFFRTRILKYCSELYNAQKYYEYIDKHKKLDDHTRDDFFLCAPQLSGSCTFYSLYYAMKYYFYVAGKNEAFDYFMNYTKAIYVNSILEKIIEDISNKSVAYDDINVANILIRTHKNIIINSIIKKYEEMLIENNLNSTDDRIMISRNTENLLVEGDFGGVNIEILKKDIKIIYETVITKHDPNVFLDKLCIFCEKYKTNNISGIVLSFIYAAFETVDADVDILFEGIDKFCEYDFGNDDNVDISLEVINESREYDFEKVDNVVIRLAVLCYYLKTSKLSDDMKKYNDNITNTTLLYNGNYNINKLKYNMVEELKKCYSFLPITTSEKKLTMYKYNVNCWASLVYEHIIKTLPETYKETNIYKRNAKLSSNKYWINGDNKHINYSDKYGMTYLNTTKMEFVNSIEELDKNTLYVDLPIINIEFPNDKKYIEELLMKTQTFYSKEHKLLFYAAYIPEYDTFLSITYKLLVNSKITSHPKYSVSGIPSHIHSGKFILYNATILTYPSLSENDYLCKNDDEYKRNKSYEPIVVHDRRSKEFNYYNAVINAFNNGELVTKVPSIDFRPIMFTLEKIPDNYNMYGNSSDAPLNYPQKTQNTLFYDFIKIENKCPENMIETMLPEVMNFYVRHLAKSGHINDTNREKILTKIIDYTVNYIKMSNDPINTLEKDINVCSVLYEFIKSKTYEISGDIYEHHIKNRNINVLSEMLISEFYGNISYSKFLIEIFLNDIGNLSRFGTFKSDYESSDFIAHTITINDKKINIIQNISIIDKSEFAELFKKHVFCEIDNIIYGVGTNMRYNVILLIKQKMLTIHRIIDLDQELVRFVCKWGNKKSCVWKKHSSKKYIVEFFEYFSENNSNILTFDLINDKLYYKNYEVITKYQNNPINFWIDRLHNCTLLKNPNNDTDYKILITNIINYNKGNQQQNTNKKIGNNLIKDHTFFDISSLDGTSNYEKSTLWCNDISGYVDRIYDNIGKYYIIDFHYLKLTPVFNRLESFELYYSYCMVMALSDILYFLSDYAKIYDRYAITEFSKINDPYRYYTLRYILKRSYINRIKYYPEKYIVNVKEDYYELFGNKVYTYNEFNNNLNSEIYEMLSAKKDFIDFLICNFDVVSYKLKEYVDNNYNMNTQNITDEEELIFLKEKYYNYYQGKRDLCIYVFEVISGFYIKQHQYDFYNSIINELLVGKTYKLRQFLMGKGKTSVIMPLLLLRITLDKKFEKIKNILCVMPEHLIKQSTNIITKYLQLFHNADIITNLKIDRNKNQPNMFFTGTDYDIYDPQKKIIFLSDTQLKTIKLNDAEYGTNIMSAIKENGLIIIDEADYIMDPTRSDLNYPKKSKHDKSPEYLHFINNICQDIAILLKRDNNFYIKDNASETKNKIILEYLNENKDPEISYFLRSQKNGVYKNEQDVDFKKVGVIQNIYNSMIMALGMIFNKDYGIGNKVIYSVKNDKIAIPYAAVNTPVDGSEFTDIYLTMVLTIFSYHQHGLYKNSVLDIIDTTSKNMSSLFNFFSYFWTLYGLDLKTDILAHKVNKLVLDDIKHLELMQNNDLIKYYIYNFVLKKYISQTVKQYNSSFIDVIMDDTVKYKVGFSGTTSMHVPTSINNLYNFESVIEKNNEDDKEVKKSITCGPNKTPNKLMVYNNDDIDDYIKIFAEYDSVIDTGAFLRKYSAFQFIQKVQQYDLTNNINRLYVYIDKDLMLWDGINKPVETTNNHIKNISSKLFIYYDNKNTIGIDIEQKFRMNGIVTVDTFNTLTNISQGIYRLRKINIGHYVDFLMNSNISNVKTTNELYDFLIKKEDDMKTSRLQSHIIQNIKYLLRMCSEFKKYYLESVFFRQVLCYDDLNKNLFIEFINKKYCNVSKCTNQIHSSLIQKLCEHFAQNKMTSVITQQKQLQEDTDVNTLMDMDKQITNNMYNKYSGYFNSRSHGHRTFEEIINIDIVGLRYFSIDLHSFITRKSINDIKEIFDKLNVYLTDFFITIFNDINRKLLYPDKNLSLTDYIKKIHSEFLAPYYLKNNNKILLMTANDFLQIYRKYKDDSVDFTIKNYKGEYVFGKKDDSVSAGEVLCWLLINNTNFHPKYYILLNNECAKLGIHSLRKFCDFIRDSFGVCIDYLFPKFKLFDDCSDITLDPQNPITEQQLQIAFNLSTFDPSYDSTIKILLSYATQKNGGSNYKHKYYKYKQKYKLLKKYVTPEHNNHH